MQTVEPTAGPSLPSPELDVAAAECWIYPTNMPVRAYQHSISKVALLHNTLVSLPTGMGKTLIAAVVMYNLSRWFPRSRLAFLAPTKPLVHQQIRAVRESTRRMPMPACLCLPCRPCWPSHARPHLQSLTCKASLAEPPLLGLLGLTC